MNSTTVGGRTTVLDRVEERAVAQPGEPTMNVLPLVFMLLVAGAIGAALYLTQQYIRKQKAKMRAVAATAGLEVDVANKKPPPLDFDLFDRGGSKRVQAQMWRAGEQDSVFQYRFTESSGEHSTTYRFTVAMIRLPFRAPHLTIASENWWSKIKHSVGARDIEVESPVFNDRFLVNSTDERFAITLLDPPMIAWMLSPYSGSGTITFELHGEWMLCHRKQLGLEELPQMLTWSQSVLDQLPVVLTDLYGR